MDGHGMNISRNKNKVKSYFKDNIEDEQKKNTNQEDMPLDDKGNTKTLSSEYKRISPSKIWCFTLNNYTGMDITDIHKSFISNANKFIVGKEIGEECGTPHLQGWVFFNKAIRPMSLKLNNKIHWEKCKGTEKENIDYCSKDGNITFSQGVTITTQLEILKEEQLYQWEKDIIEIIKKKPDNRTIHWFWEPTGNTGKSTFTKYLCYHYNAIPIEGKKNDILYCAAEHESNIYIFDFERSMEDYISYAAMEKIKNGCYMCGKYESKPIIRNCPHIICFANFLPDINKLSKDRWIIKRLKPNNLKQITTTNTSNETKLILSELNSSIFNI